MVDRPSIEITDRADWRAWLVEHHATSDGVWVVTYKKAAGERHVPYVDLVLEALCFGWVDSQAKGVDAERTSITMTPRRAKSRWTQPNRERIEALAEAGLLQPAGIAAVEAAKASGAWDELRSVEALEEPEDLRTALDADPAVRARWDTSTRTVRFQHLLQLHDTKRAETRARRIAAIVDSLTD
jgi:uncharacterized protein YdeI (YjbR/CyaY-like superfamily)